MHDRHKPTVITTDRVFAKWNQLVADDAVAHATLDRLAARAEGFYLEGTSYRETHRRPRRKAGQEEAEGSHSPRASHAGVAGAHELPRRRFHLPVPARWPLQP